MLHLLYPLDQYYSDHQAVMPEVEEVEGAQMPQPYQLLLVHTTDMTTTLKGFYQEDPILSVLEYQNDNVILTRRVVLYLPSNNARVEFGEIKIHLNCFDDIAKQLIVEGLIPLGEILKQQAIEFVSSPRSYFQVKCDEMIGTCLSVSPGVLLYGRNNQLTSPNGDVIADIVEILPNHDANNGICT